MGITCIEICTTEPILVLYRDQLSQRKQNLDPQLKTGEKSINSQFFLSQIPNHRHKLYALNFSIYDVQMDFSGGGEEGQRRFFIKDI